MNLTESEIDKMFGAYLNTQLRIRHISVPDLARASGVPLYRLNCIIRGEAEIGVRRGELERLAPQLNIDLPELMRNADGSYVESLLKKRKVRKTEGAQVWS